MMRIQDGIDQILGGAECAVELRSSPWFQSAGGSGAEVAGTGRMPMASRHVFSYVLRTGWTSVSDDPANSDGKQSRGHDLRYARYVLPHRRRANDPLGNEHGIPGPHSDLHGTASHPATLMCDY